MNKDTDVPFKIIWLVVLELVIMLALHENVKGKSFPNMRDGMRVCAY